MSQSELEEKLVRALREVYDPEIPVNIYDLGLVYEAKVSEEGEIYVKMGVTTPFCPIAFYMATLVEEEIKRRVPEAKSVRVEVTLDPPWHPSRVTPEGRERLKQIYGYDVIGEMLSRELSSKGKPK
ncbi:MAG: iron-sulfur cluster assembly protein [Fervidicoccaceae archaeon]